MNYEKIKESREYNSDRGSCSVVACSVAFGVPFPEMQKVFEGFGRKKNRGVYFDQYLKKVSKMYGFKVQNVPLKKARLTPKNCKAHLGKGTFILGTRGHVLTLKNGIVEDWTNGRGHRVNRIWKITGKKVKPLTFDQMQKTRKRFF
tara:strand:+ start:761 stop:1198 length:438 start_codon:yes stop_codon:yes gene_type:complete